jgi:glucose-1-phosphate thymidylyltransferase
MKAVVLARGEGRRMRTGDSPSLDVAQRLAAAAGQKGLMPIGATRERVFLDFVLSGLADAGCTDICLVVAPNHERFRQHYENEVRLRRIRLTFAVQAEPTGTAGAVLSAEAFVGRDAFLALNADNLYPTDVIVRLTKLQQPGLPAFDAERLVRESGFPAERVAAFALLDVDAEGYLRSILEKPGLARLAAAGTGVLVSMNVWRFDDRIFAACRQVRPSPRGEYELPEAVDLAIRLGVRFAVVRGEGAVLDLSTPYDVGGVSRRLEGLEPRL